MTQIILCGATGRMGLAILDRIAKENPENIVGAITRDDDPLLHTQLSQNQTITITNDYETVFQKNPHAVIIDFSHASATEKFVASAKKTGNPIVIGTTGLSSETQMCIKQAQTKIKILQAPNMSIGVNVLFYVTKILAKTLPESFDPEILEIHHRMKKDAPSGTAVKLAQIIAEEYQDSFDSLAVMSRVGQTGERKKKTIGVQTLRGGQVIGEHTVYFISDEERIELTHRAVSRNVFADGAILAAKWLGKHSAKCGLFDMSDVLQLKA